jgi:hypothetical protein
MLIITLSIITILASFAISIFVYKKEPTLLKKVYTTNLIDYVLGPVLFSVAFGLIILLNTLNLPKFLTFSVASLIDGKSSSIGIASLISNLDRTPSNLLLLLSISIGLIFCLPAMSFLEEFLFRYEKLDIRSRLLKSVSFGLIHFSVGVPVCAVLVLILVGFVFSIKYVKSYELAKKNKTKGIRHDTALLSSTSLHTKYNLTLFLIIIFYLSTSFLK